MQFRATIFDQDGTLIDHFEALYKCYRATFEKLGEPVHTFEQVKRAVGGSPDVTMRKLVSPRNYERAIAYFRDLISGDAAYEGLRLLPHVDDALRQLRDRGVLMAVLTNKWGDLSRRLLRHLNIQHYFVAVIGVHDTPWIKPAPELTHHVLQRLGVTATETLLVGDSPFDIATARAAGLKVCVMPTGTHTREELENERPDWVVNSMRDVLGVVECGNARP